MLLSKEEWMDLRAFRSLRAAGATWADIAREAGCDWRTAKKYLTDGAPGVEIAGQVATSCALRFFGNRAYAAATSAAFARSTPRRTSSLKRFPIITVVQAGTQGTARGAGPAASVRR